MAKFGIDGVLVTRLILNEFSLYTKDSPLSLVEYKLLIKKIHGIASLLPPDIHLLLATVPVLWSDNSVHNCALYVQSPSSSGGRPIIHYFSKENPSRVDFRYADKAGHTFPLRGDKYGEENGPASVLWDTEVRVSDINQYGSALKIVTSAGETFITLIDICFDHRKRVAETNLVGLIKMLTLYGQKVPLYMSQVITSHVIAPIKKNLFTLLTQADIKHNGIEGIEPEEKIHLPSSFGQFVDIATFPPIYLEIPYRKRVLRHMSSAVTGEAILQEAIENPGNLGYFARRMNTLAKIGVSMSLEAQTKYRDAIGITASSKEDSIISALTSTITTTIFADKKEDESMIGDSNTSASKETSVSDEVTWMDPSDDNVTMEIEEEVDFVSDTSTEQSSLDDNSYYFFPLLKKIHPQ